MVEEFKLRKLVQNLESLRGSGTSMISLIIPPGDSTSLAMRLLTDEFGKASNIKSRVNRQSVQDAVVSTQQRLKLYPHVPPHGLAIYCGTAMISEGGRDRERKITIDIEPSRPLNTSLYYCDNRFHTEPLRKLLETDETFGFIVMDGHGCLFATLTGNSRHILHRMSVELPKKHGRGGQSSVRFARLRVEKRHNYVRRISELVTQYFLTDGRPNITGIVLAGSADFKTVLAESDLFDPRLTSKILGIFDVANGGDIGFEQAISQASSLLHGVKVVREKEILTKFFEQLARDSCWCAYGVENTMFAQGAGALQTLIVWDDLKIQRIVGTGAGTDQIAYVQEGQKVPWEVVERVSLSEWLAEHVAELGCTLEIVSDRSVEGTQFCRGLGGIGGIMRYKMDISSEMESTISKEEKNSNLDDVW